MASRLLAFLLEISIVAVTCHATHSDSEDRRLQQDHYQSYLKRRAAFSDGSSLPGSFESAPEWIKHFHRKEKRVLSSSYAKYEQVGLYFPITHSSVLSSHYKNLNAHDIIRGHRRLASSSDQATFDLGGELFSIGLYYITLAVGPDRRVFNLAVDTGSSLTWLPCDCEPNACATINSFGIPIVPYSTDESSTGAFVACSSAFCLNYTTPPYGTARTEGAYLGCHLLNQTGSSLLLQNASADAILPSANEDENCEYFVRYGDGSTTAGNLYTDYLWLQLSSNITSINSLFGCGRTQSGNFVDNETAFDGLLGLGKGILSLPSQLGSTTLGSSYSICMEGNGYGGHLILGRQIIPPTALSTPLIVYTTDEGNTVIDFYTINVTAMSFNGTTVGSTYPISAIVDSGTTFTILESGLYSAVESAVFQLASISDVVDTNSGIRCGLVTDVNLLSNLVPLEIATAGGDILSIRPASYAFLASSTADKLLLCVAFTSFLNVTIIGASWLKNMDVIYNADNNTLHWLPVNCSTGESLTTSQPLISFPSPSAAAAPLDQLSPPIVRFSSPPPSPSTSPLLNFTPPPVGLNPIPPQNESPPPPQSVAQGTPPGVPSSPPGVASSPPPTQPSAAKSKYNSTLFVYLICIMSVVGFLAM